jgi:beta-mannosidase
MMVWQEFPLACNDYPDDESYLSVLRPEARAIIERVGQHPSTVLWSGGNELYNSWSGMDDQSLALRWINSLCLELTPEVPFIPTSPLQGMGHGHYLFYDPSSDEDICQLMTRMNNTALTEYGVPSPSDAEIIKKIIPPEEIFPPSPDSTAWIVHHAFKSWQDDTWLCPEVIEKYYGPSKNLEEMVEGGQKLQAAGYRFIYEAARQKWPYCSMAINWCYNEPWPTAANNSIVQHPALPKPSCESIREACRPVMASASFPKYQWHPGEMLEFDLFMLNHSARDIPAGKMTIAVNGGDIKTWQFEEIMENTVLKGPRLMIRVPPRGRDPDRDQGMAGMEIALKVLGHPEWDSVYELPVKA